MMNWDETPDLNITPLVDIMLVLLAILMVTTPALIYEEKIALPNGSQSASVSKLPDLEIRVDKEQNVYVKNDNFKLSEFPDNFILIGQKFNKDTPVYIKADKELRYEAVIFVLKSVKEAGFHKVALETGG